MKNWKTTLGGSLTATGTMLMGAGALDWMPPEHKSKSMMIGFIMMAVGTFFTGLFSRDRNVTSSSMGLPIDQGQLTDSFIKGEVVADGADKK